MPTFMTGKCETCGEESDYLLPFILQSRDDGHLEYRLICPMCAKWFDMGATHAWVRQMGGEADD